MSMFVLAWCHSQLKMLIMIMIWVNYMPETLLSSRDQSANSIIDSCHGDYTSKESNLPSILTEISQTFIYLSE